MKSEKDSSLFEFILINPSAFTEINTITEKNYNTPQHCLKLLDDSSLFEFSSLGISKSTFEPHLDSRDQPLSLDVLNIYL